MMPWKGGLLLTLGLMVGGCFLPAYQVVSWTATGVSYVFSGKGMGDHALSLALHKDCATLRILEGEEICTEYKEEHDGSWSAMASTWKVPEADVSNDAELLAGTADDPVIVPVPALVADNVETASVEAKPVAVASLTPVSTASNSKAAARGLDFDGLAIPRWVVAPLRESPWQAQAFASRGLDFGGLVKIEHRPAGNKPVVTVSPKKMAGQPSLYLVMGSFRAKANANKLASEYAALPTVVSSGEGDGRTLHRLLTGPIEKAELAKRRTELVKMGIRNSWAVRLCSGSLTVPPCKPPLQQAALP